MNPWRALKAWFERRHHAGGPAKIAPGEVFFREPLQLVRPETPGDPMRRRVGIGVDVSTGRDRTVAVHVRMEAGRVIVEDVKPACALARLGCRCWTR